jgi:hypothetical protein
MGKAGFDSDALIDIRRVQLDDLDAAPASPASGQLNLYAKSGRFYQKTAAAVEKVVGPQVASEVDIATAATDNVLLGSTVQDWLNRLYGPANSQKVTYLGGGDVDFVEIFNSASQVTANRRAKILLAYSGGKVSTETISLFDTNGTSVLKTVTLTHSYSGDDYQSTTTVVS